MERIAVIGCGMRSESYMHHLQKELGREWVLVAVADPVPDRRKFYIHRFGSGGRVVEFKKGPELLRALKGKLDGVIIGSPNAEHLESAVPAFRQKLTILLEKPVATTVADCRTMWREYNKAGRPPLAVGFVLRYTPFYRAVLKLLAEGAVGRVLTIEASELMGRDLTAMYLRGWRRFTAVSGPLLIEKCSHDLDLINAFAGAAPRRVQSFATRTVFVPRAGTAQRCRDCRLRKTCPYSSRNIASYAIEQECNGKKERIQSWDNDLCVFNCRKDIPDHQVAQIEYANGVMAMFQVCMGQPRTTRTLRICGTEGQIRGDIGAEELYFERPLARKVETRRVRIEHDASGHHGGDSVISSCFKAMLRGRAVSPDAGLKEGIEACAVGFAAEESCRTGKAEKVEIIAGQVY